MGEDVDGINCKKVDVDNFESTKPKWLFTFSL